MQYKRTHYSTRAIVPCSLNTISVRLIFVYFLFLVLFYTFSMHLNIIIFGVVNRQSMLS